MLRLLCMRAQHGCHGHKSSSGSITGQIFDQLWLHLGCKGLGTLFLDFIINRLGRTVVYEQCNILDAA